MNIRLAVCAVLFLLLSGCRSGADPTASPILTVSTSTSVPKVTATTLLVTPTIETETPTSVVVEQTATLEMRATLPPTSTPTSGLQMTIVQDGQLITAPASDSCLMPRNWVAYTVQLSDSLSSLARRTGTTWQQIQAANCLTGSLILAGQTLYLPFMPPPASENTVVIPKTPVPPVPGNPQLTVSPATGQPGDTFTILMDDFPRNKDIRLVIVYADAGTRVIRITLTPDAEGDATYYYESPMDASPGTYNVYALSLSETPVTKDGEFMITLPQTQYP